MFRKELECQKEKIWEEYCNVQERARMLEGKDLGRVLYGNETDTNEYPWQVQRAKKHENFLNIILLYLINDLSRYLLIN